MTPESASTADIAGWPCAEEGRRLFYERVGSYFLDEEPRDFPAPLPCPVCGEPISRGYLVDGAAQCAAQRSITKRRDEVAVAGKRKVMTRKDGTPSAAPGYGKFNNERRAVLITPERSLVIVNVKPARGLPNSMEFTHEGNDVSLGKVWEALLDPDLPTPFLLVLFERRCDGPFTLSTSRNAVAACSGGGTQNFDMTRVAAILPAIEGMGEDAFNDLIRLKARVSDNSANEPDRDRYLELLDLLPPGAGPALVPHPSDPVLKVVRTVLKARAARNQGT